MKLKPLGVVISGLILVTLLAGACSAGFVAGRVTTPSPSFAGNGEETIAPSLTLPSTTLPGQSDAEKPPTSQSSGAEATPRELKELFEPFWYTWDFVNESYVDQPVNQELLMQGAISGMLEALGDQHTSYMDPDQYRQANTRLEGEYDGIGAWVDANQEYLTIISPMPNSPAEKAGLKPGDMIIAIDGKDMTGIDGNLAIKNVLGPEGTSVVLTIRRESTPEPFNVQVMRARITIPTLESKILDGNIAYIRLFDFGENAADELRDALKELLAQDPVGLIFDLRGNGGGLLGVSVNVASEFIAEGVILYEQYGDGERDVFESNGKGLATDIPLVVLVDGGSASASEIVAGAIQDYGRAPLVGTTTFGKGSVQSWVGLGEDNGAVRVTIARWLTPNEKQIADVGLEPDYLVEFSEADMEAGIDPQLEKAVELLLTSQ